MGAWKHGLAVIQAQSCLETISFHWYLCMVFRCRGQTLRLGLIYTDMHTVSGKLRPFFESLFLKIKVLYIFTCI